MLTTTRIICSAGLIAAAALSGCQAHHSSSTAGDTPTAHHSSSTPRDTHAAHLVGKTKCQQFKNLYASQTGGQQPLLFYCVAAVSHDPVQRSEDPCRKTAANPDPAVTYRDSARMVAHPPQHDPRGTPLQIKQANLMIVDAIEVWCPRYA